MTEFTPIDKIEGIVANVRGNFSPIKTSRQWRIQQLKAVIRMMDENQSRWEAALKEDLGQVGVMLYREWKVVSTEAQVAIDSLDHWMRDKSVPSKSVISFPSSAKIVKEPYGVALIISPWNYPISLLLLPAVGAIAAGNAVILKPSEVSTAVCSLIAELVPKYLDRELISVVTGAAEETTKLLEQRFDYIFYTGNPTVGKIVQRAASNHLTPVTLELGGKSPTFVDRNCDLDVTCRRIIWGKFGLNLAQTCVAPDYVLVDQQIKDKFIARMKHYLMQFYGEDPQTSADLSRMINTRHTERVVRLMESTKGKIIHGGQYDVENRFISPTLVDEPTFDDDLMQEEIFGPVLPILSVPSVDHAIKFINEREKPLALYVFSKDKRVQQRFIRETSSGAVTVNDTILHVNTMTLPFGGVGNSGLGVGYNRYYTFKTFSHKKPVLNRATALDLGIRYPPTSDSTLKILNRIALLEIDMPRISKTVCTMAALAVAAVGWYLARST